LTQAEVVKPWAGRSRRLGDAGTVTTWPSARRSPPAISEPLAAVAFEAVALFL